MKTTTDNLGLCGDNVVHEEFAHRKHEWQTRSDIVDNERRAREQVWHWFMQNQLPLNATYKQVKAKAAALYQEQLQQGQALAYNEEEFVWRCCDELNLIRRRVTPWSLRIAGVLLAVVVLLALLGAVS